MSKKEKQSKKTKANQRKTNKKSEQKTVNDLTVEIVAVMKKHKGAFFVIRLHSTQSAASLEVSSNSLDVTFLKFVFLNLYESFYSLFKIQIH